jgi:hypothetical protein
MMRDQSDCLGNRAVTDLLSRTPSVVLYRHCVSIRLSDNLKQDFRCEQGFRL